MYARRDIIGLGSKEQLAGLILDEFPQFFAANNARVNLILQTLNCIDLSCEISHSPDPDPTEWEHTAIFDKPAGGTYECASKCNLSLTTLTVFYRPAPPDLLRHPDLVEKPGCKITIESEDESAQQAIDIITKALTLFLAHHDLVVCKEKTWQEHHPDYFGASVP